MECIKTFLTKNRIKIINCIWLNFCAVELHSIFESNREGHVEVARFLLKSGNVFYEKNSVSAVKAV